MAQFRIRITRDGIIPFDEISKQIVQSILREKGLRGDVLPSEDWKRYTDKVFRKEQNGEGKKLNNSADSAEWVDGGSSNTQPAVNKNDQTGKLSWTNIFRFLLSEFCNELRQPENNGHVQDAYRKEHYFRVFDSEVAYQQRDNGMEKNGERGLDRFVKATDPETGKSYWLTAYQYAGWATIGTAAILLKRFGRPDQSLSLTFTIKDSFYDGTTNAGNDSTDQGEVMDVYPDVYGYEDYKRLIANAGATNIILHGAPGTGKTYTVLKAIAELLGHDVAHDATPRDFFSQLSDDEAERFGFVQFHPSYDYTDFVEGLRPSREPGKDFELRAGTFMQFCAKARADDGEHRYYFLIDEINRGDVSNIFGELFFLLDEGYRGVGVSTQYENLHDESFEKNYLRDGNSSADKPAKFTIPPNVTIIGTMNDIDRSVDSFDFAMRRRFRFIDYTWQSSRKCFGIDPMEPVGRLMEEMNDKIERTEGLGQEYALGAAYFRDLVPSADERSRDAVWNTKIGPLLREYLRGIPDANDKLQEFDDIWHGRETGQNDAEAQEPDALDASSQGMIRP